MKYLRRAVKYFIQLTLIFGVIISVLMLLGLVEKDVNVAFRNGWKSVELILAAFAAMGFVYPLFGYGKRSIKAEGDPAEHWAAIDGAMDSRGYLKTGETADGGQRYVLKSTMNRASRLWEDAITITPRLGGFEAEGLNRDLARVVMTLERKINGND